jgi:hypothetical protein
MVFDKNLDVDASLQTHKLAWQELRTKYGLLEFRATTLSIKVADKAALYAVLQDNVNNIEQVHIGTVNDRYIASAVLKEPFESLPILKVLERRPGANDSLGLDSIDYLVDDLGQTFQMLHEAGLPVVKEQNDVHAWLSLRFGESSRFEAKLTDHVVLEVAIKELQISIDSLNLTAKS